MYKDERTKSPSCSAVNINKILCIVNTMYIRALLKMMGNKQCPFFILEQTYNSINCWYSRALMQKIYSVNETRSPVELFVSRIVVTKKTCIKNTVGRKSLIEIITGDTYGQRCRCLCLVEMP